MNPNAKAFPDYGGRGIAICERWFKFSNFVEDMGARPDGFTLDRINNDGNYGPDNCRWADRKTQQRNQRRAVFVEIEGQRFRAIELAERYGVRTTTIVARAAKGAKFADVVSRNRQVYSAGLAFGGKASGAKRQAKTHCPKGHEYTPANVILTKEGWRQCRHCVNAKNRRQAARRRSQNATT